MVGAKWFGLGFCAAGIPQGAEGFPQGVGGEVGLRDVA